MPRAYACRERQARPLSLLLAAVLLVGCAGHGGRFGAPRPTHSEVVLVARGSLNGLLIPTG